MSKGLQAADTIATEGWVVDHSCSDGWSAACLRWEKRDLPALQTGELLLRPIYLSLDPSNIVWLRLEQTYILPLGIDDPNIGMVLAEIEESEAEGFAPGEMVLALTQWTTKSIVSTAPTQMVPPVKLERIPGLPLSIYLTVFSHIGLAAMIGMREVADVKSGETVVVSAAAGAVGGLAGQIAKAHGCRVIGIAGGAEKCRIVTEELGFDEAIDYKASDLATELRRLCADGIDVYFDNVGGQTLDTVLVNLALGARVAVCGQMSQYMAGSDQQAYGVTNLYELVVRNARMQGFVPPAYAHRFDAMFGELGQLLAEGKISHRPHVVDGWEAVPEALGLLLTGGNVGKLIAQVEPDPWI